jgi:hypothetical protein
MGKLLRRGLILGAVAGVGYATWRAFDSRRQSTGLDWKEQGFPFPPVASSKTWVDPVDGECPDGFPVKAKLRSGIYHLPGNGSYDRTVPDRCYRDAAAAEADGLRPPKR